MQITNTIHCIVGIALLSNAQTVDLGSAASFGALGPAGVTNTGLTVVAGSVGTTGVSITGFPPGLYTGSLEIGNGATATADADYAAAYLQGRSLAPTVDYAGLTALGVLTLVPGVYKFDTAVELDGIINLSGAGIYVFQLASTLTTITGSSVILENGASACDVYWIVGTAATIGTGTDFAGNILASTAVTVTTGASVQGGLYAGSAVTLDTNVVNACDASPPVVTSSTRVPSSTASSSMFSSSSVPVTSFTSVSSTTSNSPSSITSKATTKSSTWKTSTTKKPTTTSSKYHATTTKIATTTKKATTIITKKATSTTSSAKPTATFKCPDKKINPIGYLLCVLKGGY